MLTSLGLLVWCKSFVDVSSVITFAHRLRFSLMAHGHLRLRGICHVDNITIHLICRPTSQTGHSKSQNHSSIISVRGCCLAYQKPSPPFDGGWLRSVNVMSVVGSDILLRAVEPCKIRSKDFGIRNRPHRLKCGQIRLPHQQSHLGVHE